MGKEKVNMQDISDLLLQIMKTTHCNCLTALMYLKGDKDVSDALFLSKPLSDEHSTTNKSDSESTRQERG